MNDACYLSLDVFQSTSFFSPTHDRSRAPSESRNDLNSTMGPVVEELEQAVSFPPCFLDLRGLTLLLGWTAVQLWKLKGGVSAGRVCLCAPAWLHSWPVC